MHFEQQVQQRIHEVIEERRNRIVQLQAELLITECVLKRSVISTEITRLELGIEGLEQELNDFLNTNTMID